jgi:PAS domain S-box-containing protein
MEASGGLDSSQFESSMRERETLAALMSQVAIALTEGGSLRTVLGRCVDAIIPNLEASFARIWLLNERSQELELEASAGLYTHLDGGHSRVPVGKFKIGRIAQERKPHLTNSVVGDPLVGDQEWAKREGMVSFAGYPLIVEDSLVGVLAMFARKRLSPAVLQALATISQGIALAVRQRLSENALRISEARKSAILNYSLDCIFTVDSRGCVVEFNPAAEEVFGYPLGAAVRLNVADALFAPAARESCRMALQEHLSAPADSPSRKPWPTESIGLRGDGSEFPVELVMVRIPVGDTPLVTIYLRDITARKRADEVNERLLASMKAAQQSYRDLAEAMPQQVWTARPEGELDYVNQRVAEFCYRPASDLLGEGWLGIVHPDDREACVARWMESVRTGDPYEVEFRLLRAADQSYRWHLGRAVSVRDSTGAVVRWLGTNTDIHDRKLNEAELALARAIADSANEAKSKFLANTSHELRTPLNAVIGYSEMLLEETAELGLTQLVPDIERIHRAGRYLLSLINNVLDLSKIESGKMDLGLENFDLLQMVNEVAETARPLLDRNRNRFDVLCPDQLGAMYADVTKVRQCLLNLLSNAAKFSSDGWVRLEVSEFVPPESPQDAKWIRFIVADSGIGVAPEDLSRLFEPFSQARAGVVESQEGTGLGLAITRQFTRLMGGEISVHSRPGEGSTFTIELPCTVREAYQQPESIPSPSATADLPERPANRAIGLLVDDDASARELMLRYLQKEGIEAVTAGDGRDALRLARELRPNFITLDVMMPGMDGWAVLSALKADPALASIPVIMVSIVDDYRMGYALGATEYLTKPVDRRQMLALVQKYGGLSAGRNILVVEDDEPARNLLKRALEEHGWNVTEAENGEVALRCMDHLVPSIILLDLLMPEVDGFDFALAVRRNEKWRHIPIIVITSMDLTSEDRRRLNGKVSAILSKSAYTREELLREIRDLVLPHSQNR